MKQSCPDIAIVGIGCRFPGGAHDPESFWDLMAKGRDGIVEIPGGRMDVDAYYDARPEAPGKMYVRHGGFLQQRIDEFDAGFFGMSPREAAVLDPQQRLLMEVAWEAIEDAGIDPGRLAGTDTGVFVGGFTLDNMLTRFSPLSRLDIGTHTAVSSTLTILANRLSYVFDLRGPSFTVDTACSSSLVALHQACQAIQRGECGQALVGGVNVIFRPETLIAMCKGGFLSPDGRSKSFDARANGYGRGEGAGIVVLKPAALAEADGDRIYAVIRSTGVNQDGRTDGITVPNPASQEALIRQVCSGAGIAPADLSYIEAHGTGTAVGDPKEMAALGAALGQDRSANGACWVGSVKANIGHLEAAAGIASLIKTALVLGHRQIPPVANLEIPNPQIDFAGLGLRLPTKLERLADDGRALMAGVNSFGYGGTNAHAVLAEAPKRTGRPFDRKRLGKETVLPISARSQNALQSLATGMAGHIKEADPERFADIVATAALRRNHGSHRLAIRARNAAEAVQELTAYAAGAPGFDTHIGQPVGRQKPVFVFSGMGPQWWAMGRGLLRDEPVYRAFAERADALFREIAGWSILDEMTRPESESRIGETQVAQPANFVLQAGLAELLKSWGVDPAAVVGHSVGEVTSAYVAGRLSLDDALLVSHHRSRIQKKAAGQGGMLAVGLSEADAAPYLLEHYGSISLAAANSPRAITLAGDLACLQKVADDLTRKGVFNRILKVEVPYHSPAMEPLKPELSRCLASLTLHDPDIPLYSTVTGAPCTAADFDGAYWCDNIREPVFFERAIDRLIEAGNRIFLEVGPHPVLASSIKDCLTHRDTEGAVHFTLRREEDESRLLLSNLARLHADGADVDWARFHGEAAYAPLPTYPWQRERHWLEVASSPADQVGSIGANLLGRSEDGPSPAWAGKLDLGRLPYITDHQIDDLIVVPGAAYVEMGLSAAGEVLTGRTGHRLEDLHFFKALVVDPENEPVVTVTVDPSSRRYGVYSRAGHDAPWETHAAGRISSIPFSRPGHLDLDAIAARCGDPMNANEHYQEMRQRGLMYGPAFQGARKIGRSADRKEIFATVEGLAEVVSRHPGLLHPSLLDACFQLLIDTVDFASDDRVYVPVRIADVRVHEAVTGPLRCYARQTAYGGGDLAGDLVITDPEGRVLADIRDVRARALSKDDAGADPVADLHYAFGWHDCPARESDERPVRRWVVLDGGDELAAALVDGLTGEGIDVVRLREARTFSGDRASPAYRRGSKDDLKAILEAIAITDEDALLDLATALPAAGLDKTGLDRVTAGLALIQAVGEVGATPVLVTVTRGADRCPGSDLGPDPSQAPLKGLIRTAINEYPDMVFRMIDADPADLSGEPLLREILSNDDEDDVALRGGARLARRLTRVDPARMTIDPMAERASPVAADGEVVVALERISQVALGDGLPTLAFGRFAAEAGATPTDPAAILLAEGGDVAPGIAARRNVLGTAAAHPDAVGLPGDVQLALPALAIAHHVLSELSRLKPGERVLLHPAGGALAWAFRAVSHAMGADCISTCLDSADLNGPHGEMLDGSSMSFADTLRQRLGDAPLDLVIAFGAHETNAVALDLLRSFGRFVQLGGKDGAASGLTPQTNRSLLRVDPLTLLAGAGEAMSASLATVARWAVEGVLDLSQLGRAGSAWPIRDLPHADTPPVGERTILITGGLGGLGFELAKRLAGQGETSLVLVGRGGADTPKKQRDVATLETLGAKVRAVAVDIADGVAVRRLIEDIDRDLPPLKIIYHAAGVLDDGAVYTLTPKQFDTVMRSKADGALNLHIATAGHDLYRFFLISSVASVLGSPGQATYVAANTFLDSLAALRRAQGLAATSVNLGAISDVGMAARHEGVEKHLARVGVGSLSPSEIIDGIERISAWNAVQMTCARMDWRLWGGAYKPWARSPRYRHLMPADEVVSADGEAIHLAGLDEARREVAVSDILLRSVASILRLPDERIDGSKSLLNMGVDSLMAMEIQADIDRKIGIKVSTLELLKNHSLKQLGRRINMMFKPAAGVAAAPAAPVVQSKLQIDDLLRDGADVASLIHRLDELNEHDLDRAIAALSTIRNS